MSETISSSGTDFAFQMTTRIFPEDCPVYLDAWKPALWLQKVRSHQGYFFFLLIALVLD